MAQHKWAKEIHAWADGAEIEYRTFDEDTNNWTEWQHWSSPNDTSIAFIKEKGFEYRIKPQPKEPQYLYLYQNEDDGKLSTGESEFNENPLWKYIGKIKLESEE